MAATGREAALPDPVIARAIVAEDESGKIVGFLVTQLCVHFEPLWIEQGKASVMRLISEGERMLAEGWLGPRVPYFAFAPDQRISRLAKLCGMVKLPWEIWAKRPAAVEKEGVA